jgi:hypothetical protein
MKTKIAGVANIGEEELSRLTMGRHSLGDVEGSLITLFGEERVKQMKAADVKKIMNLFTMAGANITQAPNLTKEAKAKHVAQFFEKLSSAHFSDAQRRYPELLKVASSASVSSPSSTTSSTPTPDLKPLSTERAARKIPARSMMAGGAA